MAAEEQTTSVIQCGDREHFGDDSTEQVVVSTMEKEDPSVVTSAESAPQSHTALKNITRPVLNTTDSQHNSDQPDPTLPAPSPLPSPLPAASPLTAPSPLADVCGVLEGEVASRPNLLLACTGSVASIKLPELVAQLHLLANVRVVATEPALHFVDAERLPVPVYRDRDEWAAWRRRGDPVLHIELRRWAHCLLIAPLDANTLAKMAAGMCDNLLTCVARAWDRQRPLLFAPAMNTHMWLHPLTDEHVSRLCGWGYRYIPVVTKTLVCGDTGVGAMATVEDIVAQVRVALQGWHSDFHSS